MIKKIRNSFIILLIFFVLITPNLSMARAKTISETSTGILVASNPITNPEDYNPFDDTDDDEIEQDAKFIAEKAGAIMNVIFVIGVIASILSIMIIGIKYMVGSVEQKAEYKKTMIPYFVGIFFIVGITAIVRIISNISGTIFSN